jgi:hypothetical protein
MPALAEADFARELRALQIPGVGASLRDRSVDVEALRPCYRMGELDDLRSLPHTRSDQKERNDLAQNIVSDKTSHY